LYNIIPRSGNYRRKSQYIVLTQIKNLYELGTFLDPDVLRGSYKYTWGTLQEYFCYRLAHRRVLPCHYFCELLDKDYVVYNGLPLVQQSYFLDDLASNMIIPYEYRESILVAIGEDLEIDVMDNRMVSHLSDKVLSPLMKEYGISPDRVVILDDILTQNWESALYNSDLGYNISTHKYFDDVSFNIYLKKYLKR
jgi:bifunctional DNA-binding transcriptional regulator/antitoxin component of YhaV-PrlF toxin-antitoxin module